MLVYLLIIPALVWLYYVFLKKSPLDGIPGPKPSFLVGNALQMDSNHTQNTLSKWAKEYGPVFKMKLFMDEVVVVSGADELHEMLLTKGRNFAGRPGSYRMKIATENYSDLNGDWSPELKWRRKALHSHMKQYGSGMDEIERITDELATKMVDELCRSGGERQIDLPYLFYGIANDIICVMLRGEVVHDKQERDMVLEMTPNLFKTFNCTISGMLLDEFPWTRHFGNPSYKMLQEFLLPRKAFMESWIKNAQKHLDKKGFINKLLQLTESEREQNGVTDSVIQGMTFQAILAGSLTTSLTLSQLSNCLVHHPHIQKRLQEEVKNVVGYDRPVSIKDRPNLPYHVATLYEISRLTTIVVLLGRKTMSETNISGYKIPKDTTVFPNMYGMHHDEQYWEDPYAFSPERFLDEHDELVPADHPNRRHLMPFGAGTRVCVGEILAQSRMFLILAKIMQSFTLLPETTLKEQPTFDPREHETRGGLLFAPEFKVRIKILNM